jgi:hypothetical protein
MTLCSIVGVPTFRSNVPPLSSMLVTTHNTTERRNPEEHNRHFHRRVNIISHTIIFYKAQLEIHVK